MAYKTRKRKVKKNIPEGIAHIHSTFNNTITTVTDKDGNAIAWSSSGALGFKGSKKSTPYAAGIAAEAAGKAAYDIGMRKVEVYVKKQDINDAVANAIIITSSINYNKNIIQNMIGKDLTTVEEEVNVFEIKDDSSSTLQIDDTYHEDEKYDSEIIR